VNLRAKMDQTQVDKIEEMKRIEAKIEDKKKELKAF